jgi:hypothetical protein
MEATFVQTFSQYRSCRFCQPGPSHGDCPGALCCTTWHAHVNSGIYTLSHCEDYAVFHVKNSDLVNNCEPPYCCLWFQWCYGNRADVDDEWVPVTCGQDYGYWGFDLGDDDDDCCIPRDSNADYCTAMPWFPDLPCTREVSGNGTCLDWALGPSCCPDFSRPWPGCFPIPDRVYHGCYTHLVMCYVWVSPSGQVGNCDEQLDCKYQWVVWTGTGDCRLCHNDVQGNRVCIPEDLYDELCLD